jgi:signal transduction histidine kinase
MNGAAVRFPLVLLTGLLSAVAAQPPQPAVAPSALEQRLKAIDIQLTELATYSLGSGIGAIGYRSPSHETEDHTEWIEVDFGQTVPLDEVMLVPAIRRDAASGFQADGFPQALRLVAGTEDDREGKVVTEYASKDELLPRIAPLVVPCRGAPVSWIRIEATVLSLRGFDRRYVFQLSEVLAFSGQENVALHRTVRSSSGTNPVVSLGWADSYAVDGFLPYLMNAPGEKRSVAFHSPRDFSGKPALVVDLGAAHSLSRLHLHAVDQSDTVPQAFAGDFGIPKVLRVEGAATPDFSEASQLVEFRHDNIYDVGPILMWTFPETECRYVRLQVVEPDEASSYEFAGHPLGFAEVELFSGGTNVALHSPVTANFKSDDSRRRLSNLTDGLNFYGIILPVREWLHQLARRHELERARPVIVAEIGRHYAHQKTLMTRLIWLTFALSLGVVVIVVSDRVMRQRAIERTRKRIAADLHDELGADLHAIGLLTDLAQSARSSPERLGGLLQRIRSLTERAGKAARHCTNMLEARGLYGDLVDDMRRTAARVLADLGHEIEFEGESLLRKLSARKRIDLLLFCQECLTNIIRHSGATRVHIRLTADGRDITLTVSDNGRGLDGEVPSSLRRRARLLGAEVEIGPSDGGGTCIRLRLRTRRWGRLE